MIFVYNSEINRVNSFITSENLAQLHAEEWPEDIYFFGELASEIDDDFVVSAYRPDFNRDLDRISQYILEAFNALSNEEEGRFVFAIRSLRRAANRLADDVEDM